MQDNAKYWLLRAKSNFELATKINKNDLVAYGGGIYYEDLCFDLQQCVEKSLKALLVHHNIYFPKTHSISKLIDILDENKIRFPKEFLSVVDLVIYAVETRYPGYQDVEISEEEYNEAVEIAQKVYEWVENLLGI